MPRMMSNIAELTTDSESRTLTLSERFRRNLGEVLQRQHGSKMQLARALGWSDRPSNVTEILKGTRRVDLDDVEQIAEAVGCTAARLLRN